MCGIIGIIGPNRDEKLDNNESWAAYEAYRGLLTLQHRGQDAAGILSYNNSIKRFYQEKDLGLVGQVFNEKKLDRLSGSMAIGHTRYATVGSDNKEDLQPLVTGFPNGLGLVHNGNVVNYHNLSRELISDHHLQLLTHNDLEVILHLWSHSIMKSKGQGLSSINFEDAVRASKEILNKVHGGFALIGAIADGGLMGLRDPNGIRPMVLGRREVDGLPGQFDYCLTSETTSLNFLGYDFVKDIAPGELIYITVDGEIKSRVLIEDKKPSYCMFEWVYFAAAESQIETQTVYQARLNLGKMLANKVKTLVDSGEINPEFVCPVPDTSRTASISLAENMSLPYREGLIKNRYVQRSFILNTQEKRDKAVELKLSPVISEIKGKNILLVDDSIVRGTTSRKIIELLKRNGAAEVTLAITCPPLRYACYYGIDFPDEKQLIANGKAVDEIAQYVGANKVIYLDEKDLSEAIGIDGLCMACINGQYPTSTDGADEFSRRRQEYKKQKKSK